MTAQTHFANERSKLVIAENALADDGQKAYLPLAAFRDPRSLARTSSVQSLVQARRTVRTRSRLAPCGFDHCLATPV